MSWDPGDKMNAHQHAHTHHHTLLAIVLQLAEASSLRFLQKLHLWSE